MSQKEPANYQEATSPIGTEGSPGSTLDQLGPFSSLLSDEDRERKAEATTAGTYNVIVNPSSFAHLPEYNDEVGKQGVASVRRGSPATSSADSEREGSIAPLLNDPNIIVLKQFEDSPRRPGKESHCSNFPGICKITNEDETPSRPGAEPTSMRRIVHSGPDFKYLQQFRHVVWKQLVQAETEDTDAVPVVQSGADVLEHQAAYFPPVSAQFELLD